jgi:hypothetical protein
MQMAIEMSKQAAPGTQAHESGANDSSTNVNAGAAGEEGVANNIPKENLSDY